MQQKTANKVTLLSSVQDQLNVEVSTVAVGQPEREEGRGSGPGDEGSREEEDERGCDHPLGSPELWDLAADVKYTEEI